MTPISSETSQFRALFLECLVLHGREDNISHKFINMVRLHRDTNVADYTVPDKCLSLLLNEKHLGTQCGDHSERRRKKQVPISEVVQSIPATSATWPLTVSTANLDPKNGILLKLDRVHTFKNVITKYTLGDIKSFFSPIAGPPVLIVSSCRQKTGSKNPGLEERNHLRCQLISHHLRAVCELLGIEVKHLTLPDEVSSTVVQLTGGTSHPTSELDARRKQEREILEEFVGKMSEAAAPISRMEGPEQRRDEGKSPDNQPCEVSHPSTISLKDVLRQHDLPVGSKGYMSNLGEIRVLSEDGSATTAMRDCAKLEMTAGKISKCLGPSVAVHLSTPSQSYHQQRVDLLWRALSTGSQRYQHVHATVGAVTVTGCRDDAGDVQGSLESLRSCYETELRAASALKYGEEIQDSDEEVQRRFSLTKAAIKFDILTSALGSVVKLDVSPRDHSAESRPGVFVLYNYARLATLLQKFEQQVTEGIYPPLPPVEQVQFEMLQDPAEWNLLFTYILQLPEVVIATLGNILSAEGPSCDIYPNKTCRFLQSLSRDLSIYYRRTHILREPRPHLLPTMFARIYLLKTLMLVMRDGLSLLDIEPLNRM